MLITLLLLSLLLHLLNGLFSKTTCVSRYKKGKTSLDLNEARNYVVLGWQWHQLDHKQTICTLLQTDNHTNTSPLNFYTSDDLPGAKQCKNTEGKKTQTNTAHPWKKLLKCIKITDGKSEKSAKPSVAIGRIYMMHPVQPMLKI